MLWKLTERYDDLRELGADLNGTPLAGWLTTPYSYLATTKPSSTIRTRSAAARAGSSRGTPRTSSSTRS